MKKLIFILSLFLLLYSCKNDKNLTDQQDKYIDIKILSTREYSTDERSKIRLALKRFNENVVIENGQYVIKAKNGDEIGIPNEFFYLFKMGIDDTNDLAREAGPDWKLAEPN